MAKRSKKPDESPLARWSADAVLQAWRAQRAGKRRGGLAEATVRRYTPILRLWIEFLATRDVPVRWWEGDAALLAEFAGQRPPRTGRHANVSSVTAARYWRIVRQLYESLPAIALANGMEPVEHPLAVADPPEEARSEVSASTTLTSADLARVAQRLRAPLDTEGSPQPWTHVRNRATLALLLATAATVRDLAHLRVRDLTHLADGRISVRLGAGAKPGEARARTLIVDGEAASWLHAWLDERSALTWRSDVLFFSVKGRQPLTPVHLWHTVSAEVKAALAPGNNDNLPYQIGPNLIRNSVVLTWIEARRPVEDIMRDAGLAEPRLLKRLVDKASAGAQEAALSDPLLASGAEQPSKAQPA